MNVRLLTQNGLLRKTSKTSTSYRFTFGQRTYESDFSKSGTGSMEKGRFIRNADHMNRIISIKGSIVNLKLYDDIVNITEDDFSEMLLSLPDWRKEKALSYRFLSDRDSVSIW